MPVDELAMALVEEFFREPDELVSRRNASNQVCQALGLVGPSRRYALRILAEAWQLLEHQLYVCRDLDQTQGDWLFLTRAGQELLRREEREIALHAALNPNDY